MTYLEEIAYKGITPARAGNSGNGADLDGVFGDHPRACGE